MTDLFLKRTYCSFKTIMERSMSETQKQWTEIKFRLGIHTVKMGKAFLLSSHKADGDHGVNRQDESKGNSVIHSNHIST